MGPTTSSYEQANELTNIAPEGRYQMDHNTLWLIANGIERQSRPGVPRPYKGGPNQIAPPGPCYDCGGNHWIRDCPNPRREKKNESGVPLLSRSCIECGIKHLVQDCPVLAEKKGKKTLNYVEVLPPSSNTNSSSKMEQVVPLKVITRA